MVVDDVESGLLIESIVLVCALRAIRRRCYILLRGLDLPAHGRGVESLQGPLVPKWTRRKSSLPSICYQSISPLDLPCLPRPRLQRRRHGRRPVRERHGRVDVLPVNEYLDLCGLGSPSGSETHHLCPSSNLVAATLAASCSAWLGARSIESGQRRIGAHRTASPFAAKAEGGQ